MRGEKETLKKAKGLTDKQFNDCVNKLTGTKASFFRQSICVSNGRKL